MPKEKVQLCSITNLSSCHNWGRCNLVASHKQTMWNLQLKPAA